MLLVVTCVDIVVVVAVVVVVTVTDTGYSQRDPNAGSSHVASARAAKGDF